MPTWYCGNCGTGPLHSEIELVCVACNVGQYSASFSGPEFSAPQHVMLTHPTTTQSTATTVYQYTPTSSSNNNASHNHNQNHNRYSHTTIQTGSYPHRAPVEGEVEYRWECHRCGYDNSWDLNPCCMETNCGHWVEGCKKCHIYVNDRKRYTFEDVH